jgi:hypothetical protein
MTMFSSRLVAPTCRLRKYDSVTHKKIQHLYLPLNSVTKSKDSLIKKYRIRKWTEKNLNDIYVRTKIKSIINFFMRVKSFK